MKAKGIKAMMSALEKAGVQCMWNHRRVLR
jgi:hypothetical protein